MKNKKVWMFASAPKIKGKPTEAEKSSIQNQCKPLVEEFKKQYVQKNPDKQFNYLTDVYTKWHQHYFYFCEKWKSEHRDRIRDEFEEKFVRLEYTSKDRFKFSYFRHTGQWSLVATDTTLNDCLEMMRSNPNFQPIS